MGHVDEFLKQGSPRGQEGAGPGRLPPRSGKGRRAAGLAPGFRKTQGQCDLEPREANICRLCSSRSQSPNVLLPIRGHELCEGPACFWKPNVGDSYALSHSWERVLDRADSCFPFCSPNFASCLRPVGSRDGVWTEDIPLPQGSGRERAHRKARDGTDTVPSLPGTREASTREDFPSRQPGRRGQDSRLILQLGPQATQRARSSRPHTQ